MKSKQDKIDALNAALDARRQKVVEVMELVERMLPQIPNPDALAEAQKFLNESHNFLRLDAAERGLDAP